MTLRRAVREARRLAALIVAAGCANQTTWIMPPVPVAAGPVNGLLLDERSRPLPDQIVAVGAEKTTSDAEGRFKFANVPVNYDLVVATPDRAIATVYQGLTRRDPIVTFRGLLDRQPVHKASIAVTLASADAAAARWQIYFVSPTASEVRSGRGRVPPRPLVVEWDGANMASGVVIALSMRQEKLSIPLAMFARQPVTLRAGQAATVELRPAKAPVVRRPSPIIEVPKEDPGFDPTYFEEYRLPGAGFAVRGPDPAQSPYDIPDLTGYGLELCAHGLQRSAYLLSDRVHCGVPPGAQTMLALQSPPAFKSPAWDTHATPGMSFAWTPVEGAVYRLSLATGEDKPGADRPRVEIVTARPEAAWPDLSVVGVGFPKALAEYVALVYALGPFASMDDLVSPQGLGDPAPRDRWVAASNELSIPVAPPLGKEEAACVFEETVRCGPEETMTDRRKDLWAINRKLRHYPEFAAAVRIRCVRDCAGAEAYQKAYREYVAAHPGFDADEPHSMAHKPRPRPPAALFEGRRRAWSGGR
jgi:hypothetical protein